MTNNIIPIVFATNENYAPYVSTCIESIKFNSSKSFQYRIYIFHVGLPEDIIDRLMAEAEDNVSVECVNIEESIESIKDKLYSHSYFSQEMYYRILIPEILTEYDKVIYLDCDMVVLGDLSELYGIELGDCCIAGCRNLMHRKMRLYIQNDLELDPAEYINSGMLVFNCAEFRRRDIKNKIIEEIPKRNTLAYPDQDLINIVCRGSIYYLPINWNYLWHLERLNRSSNEELKLLEGDLQDFIDAEKDVKILHYTGDKKPWHCNAIPKAELFWQYTATCSFYDIIYERFCAANASLEKIKLVFVRFKGYSLEMTFSYNVLDDANQKSYLYIINGDIHRPRIFYKRSTTVSYVNLTQRLFRITIPLNKIKSSRIVLSFAINTHCVLPEHDRFSPLNGCSESYFAHNGILLYREEKALVLEKSTLKKRIKHELNYLKQLRKSENPFHKKSFLKRIIYFLTKPFVPSNIWLISDRPSVAGDNGEALFRFLRSERKEFKGLISPYFVIDGSSPDYKRLKSLGHIIKLSSLKHKIYALHTDTKAVSQTNHELYNVFERNGLKDLLFTEKRVFLQHGITKDDISLAYSKYFHNFDMFVTAAYPEYDSIIGNLNYGCDSSITALTGFPRHDILKNETKKQIVITPTWRKSLFKNNVPDRDGFMTSEYFRAWHSLLKSEELKALASEHGYEILFVPHNNVEDYLDMFTDIEHVKVLCGNKNYASIFSSGALLISDYSSNTFEFSYLRKPVIYYQFDADEFFSSHTYTKGYFDYEENGFGAVVKTERELLDEIRKCILSDCKISPVYEDRINSFFAYNDSNNSRRVVEEILKIRK